MEKGVDSLVHIFPRELLEQFDLVGSVVKKDPSNGGEYLEVEFREKSILGEGYSAVEWESKGFYTGRFKDFPLRGRPVFLVLHRRRWRNKQSGESFSRPLGFIAEGSRFTKEVAAFLKDIGRDAS